MPEPSVSGSTVSLSVNYVVMGPNVSNVFVLNPAQLPLLRNGLACLSGNGITQAGVTVTSTVDMVLSPQGMYGVSSSYAGNVGSTQKPCATSGSNANGQSPFSQVVYRPSKDGMVSITVTVNMNMPSAGGARRLQAVTSNDLAGTIGSLGGGTLGNPSPFAIQVATVLQNLGTSIGNLSAVTTADPWDGYNYSGIAYVAQYGGLSPPSASILAQIGPWLAALGKGLRIAQLSSIAFTSDAFVLNVDAVTALPAQWCLALI